MRYTIHMWLCVKDQAYWVYQYIFFSHLRKQKMLPFNDLLHRLFIMYFYAFIEIYFKNILILLTFSYNCFKEVQKVDVRRCNFFFFNLDLQVQQFWPSWSTYKFYWTLLFVVTWKTNYMYGRKVTLICSDFMTNNNFNQRWKFHMKSGLPYITFCSWNFIYFYLSIISVLVHVCRMLNFQIVDLTTRSKNQTFIFKIFGISLIIDFYARIFVLF